MCPCPDCLTLFCTALALSADDGRPFSWAHHKRASWEHGWELPMAALNGSVVPSPCLRLPGRGLASTWTFVAGGSKPGGGSCCVAWCDQNAGPFIDGSRPCASKAPLIFMCNAELVVLCNSTQENGETGGRRHDGARRGNCGGGRESPRLSTPCPGTAKVLPPLCPA